MNKHVEPALSVDELHEIESLAVEIANLAGAEIKSALGGIFTVRYKTGATDSKLWKDPVSEVDRKVEKLIRERLAEHFPSHDIIGEESKERPRPDSDFIWAVDPIDGTTNFINGFPMFAASIGVLHRCKPIVGAVWCATSHALRAGVYHARIGGKLITLTWKDAPHRVDDESFKAESDTKVVTIQCEEEQALILETRLKPEPRAAAQMEAAQ